MRRIVVSLFLLFSTLSSTPASFAIETSSKVISIAVGPIKGCEATKTDIYCWGNTFESNEWSKDWMPGTSIPTRVVLPEELTDINITKLGTGSGFACALFANNTVYCWGSDTYGELGDGSGETSSFTPRKIDLSGVLKDKSITDIAVGGLSACVIASGKPYCWGSGSHGQMGNGATVDAFGPVAVYAEGVLRGKTSTSIFVGGSPAVFCVITDIGEAFCWGGRDPVNIGSGTPLGDGNRIGSNLPIAVTMSGELAGKRITHISPGQCLVASEELYCWGWIQKFFTDRFGKLSTYVPVLVSNDATLAGKKIKAVEADYVQGCAIADNDLMCWGENFSDTTTGYNGLRLPRKVNLPTAPSGKILEKISYINGNAICVIISGSAACMGDNSRGQLGNGSTTTSWVPVLLDTQAMKTAQAEKVAAAIIIAEKKKALVEAESAAKREALKILSDRRAIDFKASKINITDIYFEKSEEIIIGGEGQGALSYADMNKDSKSDLLTLASKGDNLELRTGNFLKSTFANSKVLVNDLKPCSVVTGDFNKDGINDLALVSVVATWSTVEVVVLLGKADGSYKIQNRYTVGASLFNFDIYVKDLNLDGQLDLVGLNDSSKSAYILMGNGDGSFVKKSDIKFESAPRALTFADVNSDKYPDIVISNYDDSQTLLISQSGGLSFVIAALSGLDQGYVQSADLDNDGEDDLVIANYEEGFVSVAYGLKNSNSFAMSSFRSYLYNPLTISFGDINTDGLQDFIIAGGSGVVPFYGAAGRTFVRTGTISTGSSWIVLLADIDFKLGLDVIVSQTDGKVLTFLQKGPPPILLSPKFKVTREGDSSDTLILDIEKVGGTSTYLFTSSGFSKVMSCTQPKCEIGLISSTFSSAQVIRLQSISEDKNEYQDSTLGAQELSIYVSAAELKAKQEAEAKAAADLKAKQAAELKAKQEADAKAAAELKAKQEAEAKAAAELKAKQEAEAKAAAELKAKQEAEAKAAAELKAKQEAEAKAAADKAAAELKAKQEAEAKAAAELKAKQEAEAKAAAAKAASAKKTITCVKGKLIKKVTAIKPVCPKGYKKK